MQLNRKRASCLQCGDKLGCLVRNQKACHILDTDGIRTHLLNLLCGLLPILEGICITQCVGKCNLCVAAFLLGCVNRSLKVAEVVQAVEDTDDIDSVCNGLLHEILYYVIGVVIVAEDVLSAEEHLQLRILEACAKLAETIPRVFLEEAKARVKRSSAPALYGVISDLVHLVDNRKHQFRRHSCSNQRLVRIAQDGLCNLNRFFNLICH